MSKWSKSRTTAGENAEPRSGEPKVSMCLRGVGLSGAWRGEARSKVSMHLRLVSVLGGLSITPEQWRYGARL